MKELTLEQTKPMLVEMLKYFHAYCEKNGLRYFLTGGTLLGAIRHKGFIPWDDDIDINMPRKDYEKLISIFNNTNSKYKVLSLRDKGYYLASAKIINTTTEMVEKYDTHFKIGLFIDIFPMDNLSDDYESAAKLFDKVKKYRDMLICKNLRFDNNRSILKNIILIVGKFFLLPISRERILKKIDSLSRTYEDEELTAYIGTVSTGIYDKKEILEKKWFSSSCLVEFEGNQFWAPVGYDFILKRLYGEYMILPPIEKRITHHDNIVWLKESGQMYE